MPTPDEETPVTPLTPEQAREKAAYVRKNVAGIELYMQQRKPRRDIEVHFDSSRYLYSHVVRLGPC